MPIYEASYNLGLAEEERVLPVLCDYFKRDIQKIPGRFAQHDFECADYVYELKSRSNRLECFADTVISTDKFEGLMKPLVLVFSFTDSLCYIEYSEKEFETYKKSLFGRLDRSSSEAKIHVHVLVGDLVKIRECWSRFDSRRPTANRGKISKVPRERPPYFQ